MMDLCHCSWPAEGKFSFPLNDLGEINTRCKNLQMSLTVLNLSETLLGGIQQK